MLKYYTEIPRISDQSDLNSTSACVSQLDGCAIFTYYSIQDLTFSNCTSN